MSRPNVVLVVLDSVFAARCSGHGYDRETTPELDALATEGLDYRNAYANGSWTVPTHGTMFTGRYPSEHGAHADHRQFDVPADETLAGRLSTAGYDTVGLSTNPWVTSEFGFDAGFDTFESVRVPLPFPDAGHPRSILKELGERGLTGFAKYRRFAEWAADGNPVKRTVNALSFRRDPDPHADAAVLNDRVAAWLEDAGADPFFMFLNYMDAHEPFSPPERVLREFRPDACSADVEWNLPSLDATYDEATLDCLGDLYDASLRYLDERIGELFDTLDAHGIAEETLVVVTGDHGKALGRDGYVGAGVFLSDDLVRVPLVLDPPAAHVDASTSPETPVDHGDVYATILAQAGVDPDRHTDLLTDTPYGPERPGVFSETHGPHQDPSETTASVPLEGLTRVDWNGHSLVRDKATGECELATTDGGGPSDDSETLHRELEHLEALYLHGLDIPARTHDEGAMDADVRDQLQELGYL
ncbi:sulfatase [Haloarcula marina]|uniref:sulfatase n=1 Tax=Haloarcula marina TaxID=2961574 RepID=UPI0020B63E38|nr:sulfatase [Halomicroarcula marina]